MTSISHVKQFQKKAKETKKKKRGPDKKTSARLPWCHDHTDHDQSLRKLQKNTSKIKTEKNKLKQDDTTIINGIATYILAHCESVWVK